MKCEAWTGRSRGTGSRPSRRPRSGCGSTAGNGRTRGWAARRRSRPCSERCGRSRAEAAGMSPARGSSGGCGPGAIRRSRCSHMSACGLQGPAGAWSPGAAARRGSRAGTARPWGAACPNGSSRGSANREASPDRHRGSRLRGTFRRAAGRLLGDSGGAGDASGGPLMLERRRREDWRRAGAGAEAVRRATLPGGAEVHEPDRPPCVRLFSLLSASGRMHR